MSALKILFFCLISIDFQFEKIISCTIRSNGIKKGEFFMHKIQRCFVDRNSFVRLSLLLLFFTSTVDAMEKSEFFDNIKSNDRFKKFTTLLEEDELAKGWFQGPSQAWKDKIILVSFELLEPYKLEQHVNNFKWLESYIISHIRAAITAYDKKCYFHIYEDIAGEIHTTLKALIQYSISGTRIEPTVTNSLLFSDKRFEIQQLYDRLLKEREQKQ